jgi:hypothetical protein
LETKERREQLFKHLDVVLKRSLKKFQIERGQKEGLNLKWGRLIVQAVREYGFLLRSEETEIRLANLEEKLKNGVLIPNEQSKQKNTRFRR